MFAWLSTTAASASRNHQPRYAVLAEIPKTRIPVPPPHAPATRPATPKHSPSPVFAFTRNIHLTEAVNESRAGDHFQKKATEIAQTDVYRETAELSISTVFLSGKGLTQQWGCSEVYRESAELSISTVFLSSQVLHSALSLAPSSNIRISNLFQPTLSSPSDEPVHTMSGNSGGAAEQGTSIGVIVAGVGGGIAVSVSIAFLAWKICFAQPANDEDDEEVLRKTFLNETEDL
jgi:hypothetical protein